jgi:hypothetical protein
MSNEAVFDLEIVEKAFDLIEVMEVQHEFEDFYVVHVPKDVMDEWNRVNGGTDHD